MELLKTNIHMDGAAQNAHRSITLEEIYVFPENRPDLKQIYLKNGQVVIEEMKQMSNALMIKGRVEYAILYQPEIGEQGGPLASVKGNMSFEEKLSLEGIDSNTRLQLSSSLEDLTVRMIHARKMNLLAIIDFSIQRIEELDFEIPIDIVGQANDVEYGKELFQGTQLLELQETVETIRREAVLPGSYGNIEEILYAQADLYDVELHGHGSDRRLQGEISLFVIYRETPGAAKEAGIRTWETQLPFSLELGGGESTGEGISSLQYEPLHYRASIKPDLDGEERCIGLEYNILLRTRVYGPLEIEKMMDLYGTRERLEGVYEAKKIPAAVCQTGGKTRIHQNATLEEHREGILQTISSTGQLFIVSEECTQKGLVLQGMVRWSCFYLTKNDQEPYGVLQETAAFEYCIDLSAGVLEGGSYYYTKATAVLESLQVNLIGERELECKATVSFQSLLMEEKESKILTDVHVEKLDAATLKELPGLVIYTVAAGDNLWSIGKKYYVTVDAIRAANGLTRDELTIGQRLLILK